MMKSKRYQTIFGTITQMLKALRKLSKEIWYKWPRTIKIVLMRISILKVKIFIKAALIRDMI